LIKKIEEKKKREEYHLMFGCYAYRSNCSKESMNNKWR